LTKFDEIYYIFTFLTKKNGILAAKLLFGAIYHNKHSISDGEKMAKFEILDEIFQKVCTFLTNEKKSRSQKPRNCFGKTS